MGGERSAMDGVPGTTERSVWHGLVLVTGLALLLSATFTASARASASGTVTAEYSGTKDFTSTFDPSNPSVNQRHGRFDWLAALSR